MLAFMSGEVVYRISSPSELGLRPGAPNKFCSDESAIRIFLSMKEARYKNLSQSVNEAKAGTGSILCH